MDWTILGTAGTFIFGTLSIILYFRARKTKTPVFVYNYYPLQVRSHPNVSILFDNEKIENLWRLCVLFYNGGNTEIRREDIPLTGYPAIDLKNGHRLLSHTILASSNPDIGFSAEKKNDLSLEIAFDYLNPGDGGVIEILYESPREIERPFLLPASFRAPIKGARRVWGYKYVEGPKTPVTVLYLIGSLLLLLFATYVYCAPYFRYPPFETGFNYRLKLDPWIRLISTVILLTMGIWGLLSNVVQPLRKAVPKFAREAFESFL